MKKLIWAVLLLLLAILLVSCAGGITGDKNPPANPAHLRLAQLAPDLATADVWFDSEVSTDSVPFASFSSRSDVSAGTHRITWNQTGTQPPVALVDVNFGFASDSFYTISLVGRGTHTLLPLTDVQTRDATHAMVRFVNTRPDSSQVVAQITGEVTVFKRDTLRFTQNSAYSAITPGVLHAEAHDPTLQNLLLDTLLSFGADTNYTIYLLEGELAPPQVAARLKVDAP